MGVPLLDLDGTVLGHLAVMDVRPMPARSESITLFEIFASRAACGFEEAAGRARGARARGAARGAGGQRHGRHRAARRSAAHRRDESGGGANVRLDRWRRQRCRALALAAAGRRGADRADGRRAGRGRGPRQLLDRRRAYGPDGQRRQLPRRGDVVAVRAARPAALHAHPSQPERAVRGRTADQLAHRRGRVSAFGAARARDLRRHRRTERLPDPRLARSPAGGARRYHRADRRRDRNRQGAVRPRGARGERTARQADREGELRGDSGGADGERVLRA
jgi:hypothetical protein